MIVNIINVVKAYETIDGISYIPRKPSSEVICIQLQNKMHIMAIISPPILAFGVDIIKSSFKPRAKIIVRAAIKFIPTPSKSQVLIKFMAKINVRKKEMPAIVGVEILCELLSSGLSIKLRCSTIYLILGIKYITKANVPISESRAVKYKLLDVDIVWEFINIKNPSSQKHSKSECPI